MRFDWSVAWTYRALLAQGMLVTVLLTVLTMAIAVPGGIVVMLMRQSGLAPLRAAAAAFVELFRNLPLILLVYWSFYVLPTLVDVQLSPFATALIALSLNVEAYNSETFRAGVNSIRRGQYDAALALGMSRAQVMRKVVLPQAMRRILPVLASTWVALFKDTSLVSIVALFDLLGQLRASFSDPVWSTPTTLFTGFAFTGIIYFAFCFGMSRYSLFVENRLNAHRRN